LSESQQVSHFNWLETKRDEDIKETSYERHRGTVEESYPYHRTYYNGILYYQPNIVTQRCGDDCCDGYPETLEHKGEVEKIVTPLYNNVNTTKVVSTTTTKTNSPGCSTCRRRK